MTRVSIILPVYNGARFIHQSIQSALEQTFTDFELIVIDDGSDDDTPSIVEEIHDSRLKVRAYPNSGLAASRNRGLQLAQGELIAFLDADDVWLKPKLQSQVEVLDRNPQAVLAYGWTDYIDGEGRAIHSGQHQSESGNVLSALVVRNFIETGSNPVVRSEALRESGGFDESLRAAEDWDLWLRLAQRFPFAVVAKAVVYYRVHKESMSSSKVLQQESCSLEVVEKAFRRNDLPPDLKRKSKGNLYRYLTYRALTLPFSREEARLALRFLFSMIRYDSTSIRDWRFAAVALSKIAAGLILPTETQRALMKAFSKRRAQMLHSADDPAGNRQ